MNETVDIILASSSPRRRELLLSFGFDFEIISPDVEEIPKPFESPPSFAKRVAEDKARCVANLRGFNNKRDSIIISGDTIVVVDGKITGKPSNARDAVRMLSVLSGRSHEVITGLCVLSRKVGARKWKKHNFVVASKVWLKELSESEIKRYVSTGEPLDKAGAYAIQGDAVSMVGSVEGSVTNVVGLPLDELKEILISLGVLSKRSDAPDRDC